MVTTTIFPLIHTFCDLRESEPPLEPAAPPSFAISPAGELSLREYGWHQREIDRTKLVFQSLQESFINHFEKSSGPFIWGDKYRSSVYFVFSKKDIIVLSKILIGKGSFKEVYPVKYNFGTVKCIELNFVNIIN